MPTASIHRPLAIAAASLAVLLSASAIAQGPPPGGAPGRGPGRGGGGFSHPEAVNFDDNTGFTQIFDGKSLAGWDGPPDVWKYEDGCIVGESSDAKPSGTTNIIWKGGTPANFILKLEIKAEGMGANGGVQYRSRIVPPGPVREIPADRLAAMTDEQKARMKMQADNTAKHAPWNMAGYQADFDYGNRYSGQLYEQSTGRGIIAWRGDVVSTVGVGKKPTLLGTVGTSDDLKAFIKPGEWNQIEIIAEGNTLTHIINGHVMAVLVDTDPKFAQAKGSIAFEIEGGGTLKISHRNVYLKTLP